MTEDALAFNKAEGMKVQAFRSRFKYETFIASVRKAQVLAAH